MSTSGPARHRHLAVIDRMQPTVLRTVRGIQNFARERGEVWHLHLYDYLLVRPHFTRVLRTVLPSVDGVFISRILEPAHLEILRNSGVPIVGVSRFANSGAGVESAGTDQHAIGERGAEYLLGCGFRDLAFVDGHNLSEFYATERLRGFAERLQATGLKPTVHVYTKAVVDPSVTTDHFEPLAKWVRHQPKPLGVMASGDAIGFDLIVACHMADVSVPEEIAILGVDNDELYALACEPSLSSIDTRREAVGRAAAELMAGRLAGRRVPLPPVQVAPGEVVVRGSTDIVAVRDPVLARALAYIRQHVAEGTVPADVVRMSGACRRKVETLFRTHLHRSILDEIHRQRIAVVKQRLLDTDSSIESVALACGFQDVARLYPLFRKHTGMTPRDFRRSRPVFPGSNDGARGMGA